MKTEIEDVSLITRREIEARIVKPLLEAMGRRFGREAVLEETKRVIRRIAVEQGRQIAQKMNDNSLAAFGACLDMWKQNGALEIDILEWTDKKLFFNVTKCRYAEMYRELGMEDLGVTISCARDYSLIEGFNPGVTLTRTQTIMEGAAICDLRFEVCEDAPLKDRYDGE